VLKYIELKSNQSDRGPAWIARVKLSKSGRTVYFNGKALKRASGGGVAGNHFDIQTGEEYWVSGVKKDGMDRHWAGGGIVAIEASAVPEYLAEIGAEALDATRLRVVPDLEPPDAAKFTAVEHRELES
jgi:hypothetical protein